MIDYRIWDSLVGLLVRYDFIWLLETRGRGDECMLGSRLQPSSSSFSSKLGLSQAQLGTWGQWDFGLAQHDVKRIASWEALMGAEHDQQGGTRAASEGFQLHEEERNPEL